MTHGASNERAEPSATSIFKKAKHNKSKANLAAVVFSEYCSNTSIHGIGYLGARDRSMLEKIWWLLVFVLSLIVCMFLITRAWLKWQESPVIVSFAQEQTPIWEIPFPAITICPVNKIVQTKYNYTRNYQVRAHLSEAAKRQFWDISLVCDLKFLNGTHGQTVTGKTATDSISEVAPQLLATVASFMWKNKEYRDLENASYFAARFTQEGLCFTFNSLGQKDLYTEQIDSDMKYIDTNRKSKGWTIEEGYPPENGLDTYPERTLQDGLSSGISIELHSRKSERDYACGNPSSGYKILVHNPAEAPKTDQHYVVAPVNKQLSVSVEPNVVSTSKGLLDIAVGTRNCVFAAERQLRFFKMYTQSNCRTECFANVSRQHCACIPFYLPRDNNTPICGFRSLDCVKEAEGIILEYSMLESRQEISRSIENQPDYKIFKECNCLLACTTLEYTLDSFQADYYYQEAARASGAFDTYTLEKLEVTKVDIFFTETYFLALRRTELYGRTDFLANCGGLLGLFMGVSFLSLLEIFYFLTIRTWFTARHKTSKRNVQTNSDNVDISL